jgi:hypothetical protein
MAAVTGCTLDQLAINAFVFAESESEATRDDLRAEVALLADELAGDNPTPARRLCAQVAAFAAAEHWYLCMHAADVRFHGKQGEPAAVRRRDGAQRRYLAALKTIAQIEAAERRRPRMIDASWSPIALRTGEREGGATG